MSAEQKQLEADIDLIAEAFSELKSRVDAVQHSRSIQKVAVKAVEATQQSANVILQALETAIEAINAPVGENTLGSVLAKIDAVKVAAVAEVASLEQKLQAFSGQQTLLERKKTEAETAFKAKIDGLNQGLETLRAEVTQRFEAQFNICPCGKWEAGETYDRGDLVEANGSSYVSLENGNKERPSKNAKKWQLHAAAGRSLGGGGGGTGTGTGLVVVAEDADSLTITI